MVQAHLGAQRKTAYAVSLHSPKNGASHLERHVSRPSRDLRDDNEGDNTKGAIRVKRHLPAGRQAWPRHQSRALRARDAAQFFPPSIQ